MAETFQWATSYHHTSKGCKTVTCWSWKSEKKSWPFHYGNPATTLQEVTSNFERSQFCSPLSYSRTPQDMDGTLTLIFAKLETTWNITTKISAFLQLRKKWILTKFEGCGSNFGPAMPIWSFRHFWQEIQIQCTKSLQIWYKAGTYWG